MLAAAEWSCIESSIASLMYTRFTLALQDCAVLWISQALCRLCIMLPGNTRYSKLYWEALLLRTWKRKRFNSFLLTTCHPTLSTEKGLRSVFAESKNAFCSYSQLCFLKKGAVLLLFFSYCPATRKACSPSRVCVHVVYDVSEGLCERTCFSPPVLKYARAIHIQDGVSTV